MSRKVHATEHVTCIKFHSSISVQIHVLEMLLDVPFVHINFPLWFVWEVKKIDSVTVIPVSVSKIEYVLSSNWLIKSIFAPPSERARVYYPVLTFPFNRFGLLFCTTISTILKYQNVFSIYYFVFIYWHWSRKSKGMPNCIDKQNRSIATSDQIEAK